MKKLAILLITLVLAFSFVACGDTSSTSSGTTKDTSKSSKSNDESEVLVFDSKKVKIFYVGITPDLGVGEGLGFRVENSRSESIIVNMAEASYNDVMATVIQPQMPTNVTSAGKKSNQPFVFANQELKEGKVQFKFIILDEDYNELFTTDFLELTL